MSLFRQGSLFTLQELFNLEMNQRFQSIFETLDIQPVITVVSKKALSGAPTKLNYHAMVYSLVARLLDKIPTIKDLVKRLRYDTMFRLECGFTLSDAIPSEASYSRMIAKIKESNILERIHESIILQAIEEGFITDNTVAIDATHIEARDKSIASKKEKVLPKKRGRKTKAEQVKYQQEKQQREEQLTLYEKPIEAQLDASLEDLRLKVPRNPQWGIKKNSDGKNVFWYGYKGHFAVGASSQYILQSLFSSGNLNDGKAAIPLIKGIKEKLPTIPVEHITLDAGYDSPAIYQQIHNIGSHSVIAYNKRREQELIGFDKHFAPTCVREHSYRYDSYDHKYQTLKYTSPKECKECSLKHDSLCQKVYKIKTTSDLRKYCFPARGSQSWKDIYKKRTSVERVIGYLKEYFQLNNIRHCTGSKAKVHFDLCVLVYNAAKLACDRMNKKALQQAA